MLEEKRDLPFEEFPRFHSVSFVDPKETNYMQHDEREYLCPKSSNRQRLRSRPRMSSVFHMVDSKFAGGIVTRANYMTRCFRTAWEINAADIPCLKLLLWNGESSQSPTWQAVVGLMFQWIMPFIPLILLPTPVHKFVAFVEIAWVFFSFELFIFLWHIYVLYILVQNRRYWKRAWFTFEVPRGTIGLVDSGENHELTLFHFSANIRFIKTTYNSIARLHTISEHQQGILVEDMRRRGLSTSEVILYTEDFINCYCRWPKYMTLGLSICYFGSVILLLGIITHLW